MNTRERSNSESGHIRFWRKNNSKKKLCACLRLEQQRINGLLDNKIASFVGRPELYRPFHAKRLLNIDGGTPVETRGNNNEIWANFAQKRQKET